MWNGTWNIWVNQGNAHKKKEQLEKNEANQYQLMDRRDLDLSIELNKRVKKDGGSLVKGTL